MGFIYEGSRNDKLYRIACAMFGRGDDYATVLKEVLKENTWCKPAPLPEREVRRTVDSASRFAWECGPPHARLINALYRQGLWSEQEALAELAAQGITGEQARAVLDARTSIETVFIELRAEGKNA